MVHREISLAGSIKFVVDNRGRSAPVEESGIPLIATNCISNSNLYPSYAKLRFVSEETYNNWFRSHPQPDDIILTNKGSQNGAVCLVPDPVEFCIAQDMVALRADEKVIDPKYLFAALRSELVQSRIKNLNVDAVIPHFKKTDFDKLFIPYPSRQEQEFIGDLYYKLSYKIELNRQMNETLEAMAQALFKSWFVDFDPVIDNALGAGNEIPEPLQKRAVARQALGEQRKPLPAEMQSLFPDRFVFTDEMGWVPEGWASSTVGEEFDVTMGQSPPGDTYNENGDGIAFFQGRADFGFRYPNNRVYCTAPKRYAAKGDTLVSVRAPVGDANIASEDCAIGRGVAALRHKSGSRSYTYYSMLQLAEHFNVYEGEGTVFGSINQKDFKNLPAKHIPAEVLNEFHKIANQFDSKVESNSEQLSIIIRTRDVLLPKLLSGELRIPDAEKQVAEAV